MGKGSGKQFRKCFKTTDRKRAERALKNYRDKVGRHVQTGDAGKTNFEDLAERWFKSVSYHLKPSSARRRETSIGQLKPFFGKLPVRNITPRTCDEWVIRRADKVAASTFNNERETCGRFWITPGATV